jgi:hypothetical protein
MNTNETVVGTHHGVNLYPIPNHSRYLASKDGSIFSLSKEGWMLQHTSKRGYKSVVTTNDDGISATRWVHRLIASAFLDLQSHPVDHINRIKGDNRICNLRVATPSMNVRNRLCAGTRLRRGKWEALVREGSKNYCLGTFPTQEDAHQAYLAKKLELGHVPACLQNP